MNSRFYLRGEQIQRNNASQLAATCANFNKPLLNLKIQKAVLLPGRATQDMLRRRVTIVNYCTGTVPLEQL